MPHSVSRFKTRLTTIPTDSRRYRLVNFWWEDDSKIENAKACTFYWIMIPASVVGSLILGILVVCFWVLVVPVAWFLGYNPTPEKEKRKEKLPSYIPTDKMLLPKGFNPRTNEYRKHNPWYYVLPTAGVVVVALLLVNGTLWNWALAIGRFAQVAWPFGLGLLGVIVVLYLIGAAYKHRHFRFSAWWDKACPPLVVVQVKDDKK